MESQYKVCEVKLTYKSKIKASEREKILSAENAYKILLSVFDSETIQYKEFFKVILMNRANKVLGVCHISEGGLNETSADIRIIMQAAILGNASAIILAHNHPSGNIQPSMQDDQVTKR
ncbi:JAB domain-containing protein, partial [Parabacteroides merdae]